MTELPRPEPEIKVTPEAVLEGIWRRGNRLLRRLRRCRSPRARAYAEWLRAHFADEAGAAIERGE